MEMYQVRYFLSVARALNFTRAAEQCGVAQPSLSRAIKQLEGELGGELFRRERPQAILTELGHRMLPILNRCHESANSAKAVAAAVRKGEAGAVRIALSHSIDLGLLLSHVRELNRTFDGVVVAVRRGTRPRPWNSSNPGSRKSPSPRLMKRRRNRTSASRFSTRTFSCDSPARTASPTKQA